MDKKETTNHIISRLQAGNTLDEIVDELSRIFNADPAVIMRFANNVISDHPEAMEQSSTRMDMPDWMEPLPIPLENPTTEPSHSFANSDLPPGLQTIINNNVADLDDLGTEPVNDIPTQELSNNPDITLDQQAIINIPVTNAIISDNHDDTSKANLVVLSEFVFQQLKKGNRHSDIVEQVCNQTGWHWNKSQRFVARIQTKNHDKLQSGKNRVIILISIGIILVGLVIAFNSVSLIFDYVKMAALAKTNPEALLSFSPQSTIYALVTMVTGIGMIIGGGVGITRALTKQ